LAHLIQGQNAEAIAVLRRAIELDPKNAILHNNLAVGLEKEGKKDEAVTSFREAVRFKPDYADALHNLGNQLRRLGRLTEAEEEYRKALKLMPNSPDLCNHLGIALLGQAKHGEAEACFRRSLRLKPEHAEAFNNLGVLLEQLGRISEATESYQESIRIKPDSPDTHKNLALSWLMRGEYTRGWSEYEWRWRCAPTPARSFSQPRWDGRPLDGKAVLIYAEQGLGDTIQFIRYAPLVQQRGGMVLVECPGILEQLLARCPGVDRVLPQGSPHPEFAYQIPFLSLPAVFNTTIETVPADTPYLSAPPQLIESWGRKLDAMEGFKIGIAWQGSQKYGGDAHRSIPLKEFEPLTKIDGVRLISLQKGFGSEQLQPLAKQWNILDLGQKLDANGAFLDTAAIMTNLDLVVTSDTAVAHLAGALGLPVWMAVSRAADWRWLRAGDTSPWYPTMRLFRQNEWGNWGEVFQRVAREVRARSSIRSPLLAEIAPGELLDKITILEIKRSRTTDEKKLRNIRVELGALLTVQARGLKQSRKLHQLAADLKAVNEDLWQIEDDIRLQEKAQDFGDRFIELARSVYHKNDKRASIKKQVNELLGSAIVEEKSYQPYA
jgi:Flp pilus assembly protein TadD